MEGEVLDVAAPHLPETGIAPRLRCSFDVVCTVALEVDVAHGDFADLHRPQQPVAKADAGSRIHDALFRLMAEVAGGSKGFRSDVDRERIDDLLVEPVADPQWMTDLDPGNVLDHVCPGSC